MSLVNDTVAKPDWWLHILVGALVVAFLPVNPFATVPLVYLLGDIRETLQQIASFEVKTLSRTVPDTLPVVPGHTDTISDSEGAPLGTKRRHEALAFLWGGIIGGVAWLLLPR